MAKVPKNTKIYHDGHVYTEGQEVPDGLVKAEPKAEPKKKEPKKDK